MSYWDYNEWNLPKLSWKDQFECTVFTMILGLDEQGYFILFCFIIFNFFIG